MRKWIIGLLLLLAACGGPPIEKASDITYEEYTGGLYVVILEDGTRCAFIPYRAINCDWSDR